MFHLCDRIYEGRLEETLRRWKQAGVSLRSIQSLLELELGVKIALETIRRWFASIEDDENGAAA